MTKNISRLNVMAGSHQHTYYGSNLCQRPEPGLLFLMYTVDLGLSGRPYQYMQTGLANSIICDLISTGVVIWSNSCLIQAIKNLPKNMRRDKNLTYG